MAKLCAHGETIGTVFFTTSAKRYMSDGVILKNKGFGWKLAGKVKQGMTPLEAYEGQKRAQAEYLSVRPALAAYRRALHDLCGMSLRWKLDQCISMMPDDYDGVWSECCDGYGDNVSASCDEVAEVCKAWKLAADEHAASKVTA